MVSGVNRHIEKMSSTEPGRGFNVGSTPAHLGLTLSQFLERMYENTTVQSQKAVSAYFSRYCRLALHGRTGEDVS